MVEAGEGPKAVLLCASCSGDVQGPREGSQALTLGHRRWTLTLPGKLKRGGTIINQHLWGYISKEQQQKRIDL